MAFASGAVDVASDHFSMCGQHSGGVQRVRNVGPVTAWVHHGTYWSVNAPDPIDLFGTIDTGQAAQGYPIHPGESLELPDPELVDGAVVPIVVTASETTRLVTVGGL